MLSKPRSYTCPLQRQREQLRPWETLNHIKSQSLLEDFWFLSTMTSGIDGGWSFREIPRRLLTVPESCWKSTKSHLLGATPEPDPHIPSGPCTRFNVIWPYPSEEAAQAQLAGTSRNKNPGLLAPNLRILPPLYTPPLPLTCRELGTVTTFPQPQDSASL